MHESVAVDKCYVEVLCSFVHPTKVFIRKSSLRWSIYTINKYMSII